MHHTLLTQPEYAGPQIGQVPVGQNQKTAVVDDQLQAAITMAQIPADPAIARSTLQRTGRKAQQGNPLLLPPGHIPDGLADLRQCAQVMVLPHQLLVAPLLARTNWLHNDLVKVQPRLSGIYSREHSKPLNRCPEGIPFPQFLLGLSAGTKSPCASPAPATPAQTTHGMIRPKCPFFLPFPAASSPPLHLCWSPPLLRSPSSRPPVHRSCNRSTACWMLAPESGRRSRSSP